MGMFNILLQAFDLVEPPQAEGVVPESDDEFVVIIIFFDDDSVVKTEGFL